MLGTTAMALKLVTATWVLGIMYEMEPATPWIFTYGETADAIAEASNSDPLYKNDKEGAIRTASLLIALAWHESRFQPNVVGDHGRSLGLFQIQPPTAHVDGSLLLLPRSAALIAIDLIRSSFKACAKHPVKERMAWYAAGGHTCADDGEMPRKAVIASKSVVTIAEKLFKNHPSGESSAEGVNSEHLALGTGHEHEED